ncbi:MAG: DUF2520 domain-containing protein [Eubacteriaceae bacterium]|nr:DUF2520 domain-containing protein [Eubacteriaceae bacterium]
MKIGFIGAGKVGTALGIYFTKKGLSVTGYFSRSESSSQLASTLTGTAAFEDMESLVQSSKVIFITTGDDQISNIVDLLRISSELSKEHTLIHTSGALSTDIFDPLGKIGCGLCSLHPIMTFSESLKASENLSETKFTLEGNIQGNEQAQKLLDTTNNQFFIIPKESKILYHAAACVLSNYLVTLIDSGFAMLQGAGINKENIAAAFMPLISATFSNIEKSGTVNSLTGPLARGDENTIAKHMLAIETQFPESFALYQTLGIATLDMIRDKRMDSIKYTKLKNILMKGE